MNFGKIIGKVIGEVFVSPLSVPVEAIKQVEKRLYEAFEDEESKKPKK